MGYVLEQWRQEGGGSGKGGSTAPLPLLDVRCFHSPQCVILVPPPTLLGPLYVPVLACANQGLKPNFLSVTQWFLGKVWFLFLSGVCFSVFRTGCFLMVRGDSLLSSFPEARGFLLCRAAVGKVNSTLYWPDRPNQTDSRGERADGTQNCCAFWRSAPPYSHPYLVCLCSVGFDCGNHGSKTTSDFFFIAVVMFGM